MKKFFISRAVIITEKWIKWTKWPDCPGNKERIVNCNRSRNGSTQFVGNSKGLCISLLESLSNLIMKQILEYLVRNTGVSWKKIKNIISLFWNANYLRTIYIHNTTHAHTHIHKHTHTYMHMHAYAHNAYIYIYIYIHTYRSRQTIHINKYMYKQHTYTYRHTYMS